MLRSFLKRRSEAGKPVVDWRELGSRIRTSYRQRDYGGVDALMQGTGAEARPGELLLLWAHSLQYLRRPAEAIDVYRAVAAALEQATPVNRTLLAEVRIDWGLAHFRRNELDLAERVLRAAEALAPDLPVAAGCARFPDIARNVYPATVRVLPLAASEANAPRAVPPRLDVVYFFVRAGDAPIDDYCAMFAKSLASVRRHEPGARTVLLTDRRTTLPGELGFDLVLRGDFSADELMLDRFRSTVMYLDHVMREPARDGAVLFEPDALVNRPLADAFASDFDVAVTYRSRFVEERLDNEPLYAGLAFVNLRNVTGARRFFSLCAEAFPTVENWPAIRGFYPRPIRAWRGDQIVPAAVIGWQRFFAHVHSGATDRLEVDGTTLRFLPSDPWHAAFEPGWEAGVPPDKYVVNFKGGRKAALLAL